MKPHLLTSALVVNTRPLGITTLKLMALTDVRIRCHNPYMQYKMLGL